jgi:hypothetical protein
MLRGADAWLVGSAEEVGHLGCRTVRLSINYGFGRAPFEDIPSSLLGIRPTR